MPPPFSMGWGGGLKDHPCQYFQYVCPIPYSTKTFSLIQWPQEERGQLCHIDISIFIITEEANILWWLIKRLSMSSAVTMGKQNTVLAYKEAIYVFSGEDG